MRGAISDDRPYRDFTDIDYSKSRHGDWNLVNYQSQRIGVDIGVYRYLFLRGTQIVVNR